MTTMAEATLGVILAGGQGRRMEGADKAFVRLAERPLFDHVFSRLAPQVDAVIVNANGDPARFADYDLPVVADTVDGFAGPLAGVLAAMEWAAAHRPACRYLVTAATDAPFLPRDLVAQFHRVVADLGAELVCASSDGRAHPVCGLWPVDLLDDLRHAVVDKGVRKVDLWTMRHRLAYVAFDDDRGDPFFNVNRPTDLGPAEELFAAGL